MMKKIIWCEGEIFFTKKPMSENDQTRVLNHSHIGEKVFLIYLIWSGVIFLKIFE